MQLLQQLEEVSAPGSVVLTTMTPISITKRPHAPSSLVGSWVWGFGEDFPQVCFIQKRTLEYENLTGNCSQSPGTCRCLLSMAGLWSTAWITVALLHCMVMNI